MGFRTAWRYEDIHDTVNAEGLVALLHERMNSANVSSGIPLAFQKPISQLTRKKSQQSLMREAKCRRILSRLQEARIEALLLKRSTLEYWACPSAHLRNCSDIDLISLS